MNKVLIKDTKNTLVSLLNSLDSFNDKYLSKQIFFLNNYTIGNHYRHIVEFYQCLLKSKNKICYENRERNISLEKNVELLKTEINTLLKTNFLELLETKKVKITENKLTHKTSFSRELLFCNEHAIHHMAIIKIASTVEFPNIKFEKFFGVAPSTIRHLNSCVH